jgi:hypothetical protein
MVDDTNGLNRRTVLKNVVAASTFAAGLGVASGSAAASVDRQPSKVRPVEEAIGDAETVEELFAERGEPLVAALAAEGYVDGSLDASVDSFVPTDVYASSSTPGLATASFGSVNGDESVDVRLRQAVGDREVEFHLLPDGDSYALVTSPDGDVTAAVFGDGSTQDVSTSATCATGCDCYYRCTTDYCDCTVGGYIWYYEEYRECMKTDDGYCLCSWTRTGCDCKGEPADACPE